MDRLNRLDVFYHNRPVGTMALYQNRLVAFEYDSDWIKDDSFILSIQKDILAHDVLTV